jgi:hypothetical protein
MANKAKHPVFEYISACCGTRAAKEACERSSDDIKAKKFGEATLGTWRCQCGQKCKVIRKALDKKA